ncbi:Hypothetical protein DPCES_5355 [Desulfitobacterium hafniense]|uniref:Prophage pi2 protein 38 n=1 Tax=Desulfitobacterium hafniense TaxID=49338 RepID=A0A098AUW3_DESHA|nr:hypothetical protein [Desulfitobacterium hafniense]CDV96353.1 Hypothetical protein DPCES_5355 [Desulfitobacterium hafniense]
MEQAELFSLLKSAGLPVAYHHFKKPPAPPYLVCLFAYSNNFGADNGVYSKANNYQVELYTTKKDPETENLVESALDAAEIYWEKSEAYIESEELFQVLYAVEI